MSKLSRLMARFKEKELGEEGNKVKFRLAPLKNKEMLMFMDMADNADSKEMIYYILETVLKKDDPSITREELENLDFDYTMELLNEITEISGLGKLFDFEKMKEETQKKSSMMLNKTSNGLSKAESLRQELIKEVIGE